MTCRLSVIVPAFDEAARIGSALGDLRRALAPLGPDGLELVVVDDGSSDATSDESRRAGADVVLRLATNQGKGAAVRAGVGAASGDAIAYTDADLSYPPDQLLDLLREVEAGHPFVAGSRRHVDTVTLIRGRRLREVTGRAFNLLSRLVVLGRYRDTQCGLKAFAAPEARRLFACGLVDRFAFDVELFLLAERLGIPIVEVPVRVSNTESSTVRVGTDSMRMLRDLARIRRWSADGTYDRRCAQLS